jgi:hypothetical protein
MAEECIVEVPRFSGKKGACFTLRGTHQKGSWVENSPKVAALRPHWNYSWGHKIADGFSPPECIEFVPMIWGCYRKFQDDVKYVKELGPRMLMSFNEPDKPAQSNLTVETVIEAWPSMEALGIPLVSPGCASSDGKWMDSFMKEVKERGLRVDVIAVHRYAGHNVENFKQFLTKVHKKYERPVIVTEFAVADWNAKSPEKCKFKPEQVLDFMQKALPWMEEQDWILGYSWFSFGINSKCGTCSALFDEDGQLTTLGKFYAEFEANPGIE